MKKKEKVARPGGLELPTFWFVARRSIQLSYGRADTLFTFNSLAQFLARFQLGVSARACAKFVGGEISSPLGIPKTLPSGH
jgi:hypothetical protein